MIDTDKYEGHTPGPWWLDEWEDGYIDAQNWIECEDTGDGWIESVARMNKGDGVEDLVFSNVDRWKANAQLIADAPLLLAEVKRLREQVKDLEYEVENWKGELSVRMHPIDYDALVNGGEEE